MRQIVLDTETTGLSYKEGHRVIEIGCIEMVNRRLTGNRLQHYINPEREVEAEAIKIHGIDNKFLQDKPVFKDIAKEFCDFINGAELIAHNAPFDVGFLNNEFKLTKAQLGKIANYCEVIDTLVLARKLHPGQRNSLDALSKRYNINCFNRELHGALLDAEILAQVYLSMTGGQATLFGEDTQKSREQRATVKVKQRSEKRKSLPVIEVSEEELAAHNKFLQLLDE
jgi:DNA polymerase III subunit epsilon